MADLNLVVKLLSDTKSIDKGVKGISGQLQSMRSGVLRLGAGLGLAIGAREVIGFLGDAVDMASDLVEQQDKVNDVFGQSAPQVRAFAENLDSAYGLTERAALSFLGTVGNLTTAMGVSEQESADMGEALTLLAGDLAAFNNAEIRDVITALQSGLVGEAEPLRRLGVTLSAARVEAFLLEEGIAASKSEITEAQKVAARYAIIMEDTANAQGNALGTADTFAGIMRVLSVEMEELQTEIGTKLLPVMVVLARFVRDTVVPALELLVDSFEGSEFIGSQVDEMQRLGAGITAIGEAAGLSGQQLDDFAFSLLEQNYQLAGKGIEAVDAVLADLAEGMGVEYAPAAGTAEAATDDLAAAFLQAGDDIANALPGALEASTAAVAVEALQTSAIIEGMIGSEGKIPKAFREFWAEHNQQLANAKWFLDPANVEKQLQQAKAFQARWKRIEARAHKTGNEALELYAQEQQAILLGMRRAMGEEVGDAWSNLNKQQARWLRTMLTSLQEFARKYIAAVKALFTGGPGGDTTPYGSGGGGYGAPPLGRSGPITIHTSGDAGQLQATFERSLRRSQPALARGF